MKAILYLLRLISGLLFGFLAYWVIFNSKNLVANLALMLSASVIVAFFKAITFNKDTKEIKFKAKEFSRLFFVEELIKVAMVIAVALWYNKFVSGITSFLIILSSFIVLMLSIWLYYWLQKQKKLKS